MAVHLFPSSYRCDCGHQSDFFENTIKEISAASQKRRQHLADSTEEEHTIEFTGGKAVAVLCPRLGRRRITGWE
jgi:cobalamin biosynthesis Mg chelatase CobN